MPPNSAGLSSAEPSLDSAQTRCFHLPPSLFAEKDHAFHVLVIQCPRTPAFPMKRALPSSNEISDSDLNLQNSEPSRYISNEMTPASFVVPVYTTPLLPQGFSSNIQ